MSFGRKRIVITFDVARDDIFGTVTIPCENDECPEDVHTDVYHTSAEMGKELASWSDVMMQRALSREIEGSA